MFFRRFSEKNQNQRENGKFLFFRLKFEDSYKKMAPPSSPSSSSSPPFLHFHLNWLFKQFRFSLLPSPPISRSVTFQVEQKNTETKEKGLIEIGWALFSVEKVWNENFVVVIVEVVVVVVVVVVNTIRG